MEYFKISRLITIKVPVSFEHLSGQKIITIWGQVISLFYRSRNGIPRLIELVDHSYEDICNSSIVALRNLSDDIKNKEVIGQYGAGAICGKVSIKHLTVTDLLCLPLRPVREKHHPQPVLIFFFQLPSNPQVAFSTKTCVSTLYLIRILIYLNKKNCDLIIDNDGMQKIILINKEPSYPMKLRKAAGQVSLHIGEFYPSPR